MPYYGHTAPLTAPFLSNSQVDIFTQLDTQLAVWKARYGWSEDEKGLNGCGEGAYRRAGSSSSGGGSGGTYRYNSLSAVDSIAKMRAYAAGGTGSPRGAPISSSSFAPPPPTQMSGSNNHRRSAARDPKPSKIHYPNNVISGSAAGGRSLSVDNAADALTAAKQTFFFSPSEGGAAQKGGGGKDVMRPSPDHRSNVHAVSLHHHQRHEHGDAASSNQQQQQQHQHSHEQLHAIVAMMSPAQTVTPAAVGGGGGKGQHYATGSQRKIRKQHQRTVYSDNTYHHTAETDNNALVLECAALRQEVEGERRQRTGLESRLQTLQKSVDAAAEDRAAIQRAARATSDALASAVTTIHRMQIDFDAERRRSDHLERRLTTSGAHIATTNTVPPLETAATGKAIPRHDQEQDRDPLHYNGGGGATSSSRTMGSSHSDNMLRLTSSAHQVEHERKIKTQQEQEYLEEEEEENLPTPLSYRRRIDASASDVLQSNDLNVYAAHRQQNRHSVDDSAPLNSTNVVSSSPAKSSKSKDNESSSPDRQRHLQPLPQPRQPRPAAPAFTEWQSAAAALRAELKEGMRLELRDSQHQIDQESLITEHKGIVRSDGDNRGSNNQAATTFSPSSTSFLSSHQQQQEQYCVRDEEETLAVEPRHHDIYYDHQSPQHYYNQLRSPQRNSGRSGSVGSDQVRVLTSTSPERMALGWERVGGHSSTQQQNTISSTASDTANGTAYAANGSTTGRPNTANGSKTQLKRTQGPLMACSTAATVPRSTPLYSHHHSSKTTRSQQEQQHYRESPTSSSISSSFSTLQQLSSPAAAVPPPPQPSVSRRRKTTSTKRGSSTGTSSPSSVASSAAASRSASSTRTTASSSFVNSRSSSTRQGHRHTGGGSGGTTQPLLSILNRSSGSSHEAQTNDYEEHGQGFVQSPSVDVARERKQRTATILAKLGRREDDDDEEQNHRNSSSSTNTNIDSITDGSEREFKRAIASKAARSVLERQEKEKDAAMEAALKKIRLEAARQTAAEQQQQLLLLQRKNVTADNDDSEDDNAVVVRRLDADDDEENDDTDSPDAFTTKRVESIYHTQQLEPTSNTIKEDGQAADHHGITDDDHHDHHHHHRTQLVNPFIETVDTNIMSINMKPPPPTTFTTSSQCIIDDADDGQLGDDAEDSDLDGKNASQGDADAADIIGKAKRNDADDTDDGSNTNDDDEHGDLNKEAEEDDSDRYTISAVKNNKNVSGSSAVVDIVALQDGDTNRSANPTKMTPSKRQQDKGGGPLVEEIEVGSPVQIPFTTSAASAQQQEEATPMKVASESVTVSTLSSQPKEKSEPSKVIMTRVLPDDDDDTTTASEGVSEGEENGVIAGLPGTSLSASPFQATAPAVDVTSTEQLAVAMSQPVEEVAPQPSKNKPSTMMFPDEDTTDDSSEGEEGDTDELLAGLPGASTSSTHRTRIETEKAPPPFMSSASTSAAPMMPQPEEKEQLSQPKHASKNMMYLGQDTTSEGSSDEGEDAEGHTDELLAGLPGSLPSRKANASVSSPASAGGSTAAGQPTAAMAVQPKNKPSTMMFPDEDTTDSSEGEGGNTDELLAGLPGASLSSPTVPPPNQQQQQMNITLTVPIMQRKANNFNKVVDSDGDASDSSSDFGSQARPNVLMPSTLSSASAVLGKGAQVGQPTAKPTAKRSAVLSSILAKAESSSDESW